MRGRRLRAGLSAALAIAVAATAGAAAVAPVSAASGERTLVELVPAPACDGPAILRRAGAATVAPALRLYALSSEAAARVVPGLQTCGALRFAVPDRPAGTLSVSRTSDFADPLVPDQWWRAAVGVVDLVPPGPGKPVTIIDSGVMVGHPEFAGRPDLVMLNEQQPQPIGGVHGTAVASVIGAPENGVGVVGIYPRSLLQSWDAAVGTGTQLSTSQIVAGVLAASAQGPGVINLSLGSDGAEPPIQQAVATAIRRGSLVVAAAGNDGDAGNQLTYPASFAHVLTVGATDSSGNVAPFSSRSRFVDLAAPGQDVVVASALDASWDSEDGTSFASPLVAGGAAWIWTVRPDLDASQLFEIMRRSATDIGAAGRDDASGYGLLNVPAALAYPAPISDPLEPNDDVEYVKPLARYATGVPPLTTRARQSATLAARLSVFEDPRDLYQVFIPAKGRLTVRTTVAATVDLTLWRTTSPTVTGAGNGQNRLARGKTQQTVETLTFVNPGKAATAYLSVSLATRTRDATYTVSVASR